MTGSMCVRVWDVEHGCCVMLQHIASNGTGGRLAMIDSGSSADFQPSAYIKNDLGRNRVDYLFITNADQDHMSDLHGLDDAGVSVCTLFRNRSYSADELRDI